VPTVGGVSKASCDTAARRLNIPPLSPPPSHCSYIGTDECAVVEYDSTDSKLVCYTPPSPTGADQVLEVQVEIVTISAELDKLNQSPYAACPLVGSVNPCQFSYRSDVTPKVELASLGGSPGKVYRATGQLYGDSVAPYILRVGPTACGVDEELQVLPTDNLVDGNGVGSVRCVIGDAEAGRYNVSFEVRDNSVGGKGYGQALFRGRNAKQVAPDGTVFHYTQRPQVSGLSTSSTGLGGGSLVTISGAGFSTVGDNVVRLAGLPCAVVSASPTQLTCRPAPAAASSPGVVPGVFYPGSAGLLHSLYLNRNIWTGQMGAVDPASLGIVPSSVTVNGNAVASARVNEANTYGQTLVGFFAPPVTANYSFYVRGDDNVAVWLSPTANATGLRFIAGNPFYTPNFFAPATSAATNGQVSAPQYLEAGRLYAFRAIHQEGTGEDWLDVAVRVHTEGNAAARAHFRSPNQEVFRSVPEVQNVITAAAIVREVQVIRLTGASAGAWGVRTASGAAPAGDAALSLALDATTGAVSAALNGVGGCSSNNLGVVRTAIRDAATNATGFQWEITFRCPVASAGSAFPTLVPFSASLTPAAGQTVSIGASRTQSASAPLDGTFLLTLGAETTAPISYAASAWDVQSALAALTAVEGVEVTIVSSSDAKDGRTWQVTFWAPAGNQPSLVPSFAAVQDGSQGLTGASPSMSVVTMQEGSLDPFLWPAPADLFRAPLPLPAVEVVSNGILGTCDVFNFNLTTGNRACSFVYDAALTSYVSAVSATTVQRGDTLTITGTGFLPASAGVGKAPGGRDVPVWDLNFVTFNRTGRCNVTSATNTTLTCVVLAFAAGTYSVDVEPAFGRGFAVVDPSVAQVSYTATLDAVTPLEGSKAGGTLLTITGSGFQPVPEANIVTVGGNACVVVEASFSRVVCRTPPTTDSASATVSATVFAADTSFSSSFVYKTSLTASVTALSPSALSSATSNYVNLTIADVPAGTPVSIRFGGRDCRITRTSGSDYSCILTRAPASVVGQAAVAPLVEVGTLGYASLPTPLVLDAGFRVTSVSPSVGSLEGGTLVTVTGAGFTGRLANTDVSFLHPLADIVHKSNCRIREVSPDGSYLRCVTSRVDSHQFLFLNPDDAPLPDADVHGQMQLTVNKLAAPCIPAGVCNFTYTKTATPNVTSVVFTNAGGMILNGTALEPPFHVWLGTAMVDDSALTVSSDNTTVTITALPARVAGTVGVYAHSIPRGNTRVVSGASYTNPLVVSSVLPAGASGSRAGGHLLTLVGLGFSSTAARNVVLFGASTTRAPVVSANLTHLVVRTPPMAANAANVSINVTVLDAALLSTAATATLASAYSFSDALGVTPILSRVSPQVGGTGTLLRVTGTGFGASFLSGSAVQIGGVDCAVDVSSWTATTFNCTVGATPGGTHRVLVALASVGLARTTSTSAAAASTFTVVPTISAITPASPLGVGGGQSLTITGSGFSSGVATTTATTVTLCNAVCDVTAVTPTSLTCTPRPILTAAALDAFNTSYELTVLSGTPSSAAAAPALDGGVDTPFRSCTVGLDMGDATRALVTRVRFYPRFRATSMFARSVFSASATGVTGDWTTLATIERVDEGWNYVDLVNGPGQPTVTRLGTSLPAYRYLQWKAAAGSDCTGMEIQFVGYAIAATAPAGGACTVNVTVTGPASNPYLSATPVVARASLPAGQGVAFSAAATPTVAQITPNNGTALGGDVLTITGSGFPASVLGDVSVVLNGVVCDVLTTSATLLTCRTRARDAVREPSVVVTVAGASGRAVYDLGRTRFRYLDRWSALTTWADQEPPVEGDTVIVPKGQAILVDVSPPELFLVLVQGEMIFDRRDLTFDAHYILVHGGRLEVGTEQEPFYNRLTITLHGDRFGAVEIPEVGAKVLAVMNGGMNMASHSDTAGGGDMHHSAAADGDADPAAMEAMDVALEMFEMMGNDHNMDMAVPGAATAGDSSPVSLGALGAMHSDMPGVDGSPAPHSSQGFLDIHGIPRMRVWTKVAATVEAGSDTITTSEDVDWAPGERIVLTSGSWDYSEAEEKIIKSRSGRTIVVETPFTHRHESSIFPAAIYGHTDVDMRCEVGLLSRNVVIRGDEGSEAQVFGVHTGAFHGGTYRLENAELTRCGQSFNLGRYCSHYHMRGDAPEGYIRSNSIHHSYQRATTIHGTNHLRVMHNFAYRIRGHSIFVEDGVEQFNVIEGNLIAVTLRCFACLKSDVKPASFWAASPTNFWRHNVAAGSQNDGFWLEPPGNPHGPSFTTTYCPVGAPLGQFFNNTAHSNGVHGLRLYPAYTPYVDPCDPTSGPSPQYFHNFTSFRNSNHGIFGKLNGDLHHVFPRLLENRGDDFHQMKLLGNAQFTQDPNIRGGLFVSTTDPVNRPAWDKRAIWAPQNEWFLTMGAAIVNYGSAGALAGCADCDDQTEYRQGGYTTRWAGLRFFNSSVRVHWAMPLKDIHLDLDGSLTDLGPLGGWVVNRYKFNDWPECTVSSPTGAWAGGHVCNSSVQVRRLQVDNVNPRELDFKSLNISSAAGVDEIPFRIKEFNGWSVPLVNRKWYSVGFKSTLIDWRTLRLRYSEPEYIVPGEWTGTSWSWIDTRFRIRSLYRGQFEVDPLPANALPSPTDQFGRGTMPSGPGNKTWSVILSTNTNNTDPMWNKATSYMIEAAAIQCAPGGCDPPAAGTLSAPVRWSSASTWPRGVFPIAGQDLTINASSYIILDVDPPALGKLTIEGRLEFLDNGVPRNLTAASIVVWGSLIVGTPAVPYLSRADIVLTGTRTSPSVVVDNNLFVGNKVLVALGQVSLHGAVRAVTWARLDATAAAGATSFRLNASVTGSWFPGDSLVLTPTEYDHTQVETVTVSAVSGDGRTVTVTSPLLYTHFAGAAGTTGPTASIRLAAAVGLLSRNVVVRGALATPTDTYGGHVFVSVISRTVAGKPVRREGTLDARFVEFRGMGKGAMEYAALTFQYGNFDLAAAVTPDASAAVSTNGFNWVVGCSFSTSFNYGVVGLAARHLYLDRNVFHRTFRNGVDLDKDCANATITTNLFAGNLRSPDVNTPDQTQWVWPQAAVFLNAPIALLANNYVGGAFDSAYTIRGDDCPSSAAAALYMRDNEAASTLIGVFILSTRTRSGCVAVGGFKVWKAAHVGLLHVDGVSDLRVTRSVVADSHIGMSFNFVTDKKGQARTEVLDSSILGTTLASTSCSASSVCRAATMDDVSATSGVCGSVLGPNWRRAGILLPQYTNRGKTCEVDGTLTVCRPVNRPERLCGFPWERRFGLPSTRNTHMFLRNVLFSGFAGGETLDCGRESRAIVMNPTQVDMAVPVTLASINWDDVPRGARFHFRMNSAYTDGRCADGRQCDSSSFILVVDSDGTTTGTARTTILGPNPALALPSPACVANSDWPGAVCPGVVYRAAVFENMDRDRGHRKLGNLEISSGLANVTSPFSSAPRKTVAMGPIDDGCAKRFYFGQYPFAVIANTTTGLLLPSTEPGQTRIHFLSPDPNDKLVVKMFIQRPNSLDVFVDGSKVVPKSVTSLAEYPGLRDPPGSNLFDVQERYLSLTFGGSPNGGGGAVWYDIVRAPSIQLTLKLGISSANFFGPSLVNNLALLLGIDSSRIKIVSVAPADSILGRRLQAAQAASSVQIEILPPANATILVTDSNDNATAAVSISNQMVMQGLAATLSTFVESGQLQTSIQNDPNLGYAVGAVQVVAPVIAAPAPDPVPVVIDTDSGSKGAGLTSGAIAGIVIGVLVAGAAVAGAGLIIRRTGGSSSLFSSQDAAKVAAGTEVVPNPAAGSAQPLSSSSSVLGNVTFENPQWAHDTAAVANVLHEQQQQQQQQQQQDGAARSAFTPGNRNSVRVGVAPVPVNAHHHHKNEAARPAWRK
jgi:hypothetical protein